jgi:hypothetical protein
VTTATVVKIAPVRKTIRVKAAQAHAFEVFTSGLGRWWPRDHGIGKLPMKSAVMETRLGGRWLELAEDWDADGGGPDHRLGTTQPVRDDLGHQQ